MPKPDALRRLPFGFADVNAVAYRGAAPIDAVGLIAVLIVTVLPERFALADTPAAVHTLGDGCRDPLRRDEQRRQRPG